MSEVGELEVAFYSKDSDDVYDHESSSDESVHRRDDRKKPDDLKSNVDKSKNPKKVQNHLKFGYRALTGPKAKQDFDEGDDVRLTVVKKNGKKEEKKMVVMNAALKHGTYKYQVNSSGRGSEMYKDDRGNDWFGTDSLDAWMSWM